MGSALAKLLAAEQRAFLHRDRRAWGDHLGRARAFLGEGLAGAAPGRACLVLGAGSGLEIPWERAHPGTWGWDADPWSRVRTALRHRRWPPWVFEDLTGGLEALERLARRCLREPGPRGRVRPPERALERLAGLIPTLRPEGGPLRAWVGAHRPACIVSANVLGQIGVVAQRLLEGVLGPWPWNGDPEGPDPAGAALESWIATALRSQLEILAGSGAALCLLHDRAVIHGPARVSLGPWRDSWQEQVHGSGTLELEDPLAGVDILAELRRAAPGREPVRCERWLWGLAPGQLHVVEAILLGLPGSVPEPPIT